MMKALKLSIKLYKIKHNACMIACESRERFCDADMVSHVSQQGYYLVCNLQDHNSFATIVHYCGYTGGKQDINVEVHSEGNLVARESGEI
jgi:hypothetical protein